MFTNFIYFIIVLLIFSTYQPSLTTDFSRFESLLSFLGLFILLSLIARLLFTRIERGMRTADRLMTDKKLNKTIARLSVFALILTSFNIYIFDVTTRLLDFPPFSLIPTLKAAFCLLTMMGYLAIIWASSNRIRQYIYRSDESARKHIIYQLSFAVPLILPWFIMSGITDIMAILPFEPLQRFFFSPLGEFFYLAVIILLISVVGPAIVQKMWRCKPLEDGPHRTRIENLCKKAELKYANILSWPIFGGMMMTAGIMGLVKRFRYILVTPAILKMLTPEEVDSVVAHEIGHAKRYHLVLYLMFFIGYILFLGLIWDPIVQTVFYTQPFYLLLTKLGLDQTTSFSAGLSLVMILIFVIYFRFIFGYFMRNFERQADIYVYELMDNASHLITTFSKIVATSGQSEDTPNWHHFSIKERVQFLKKCEADRSHIDRHNAKIRKSIAAYISGMLILGGVMFHYTLSDKGMGHGLSHPEMSILSQLKSTHDNAELLILLGNFYYSVKDYPKAVESYESSLKITPKNPHVLNNLAWLLATCDDESIQNPQKALALSKKAVALNATPESLDTLAESYYLNGMVAEAVAASKSALDLDPKERAYYENQLEKFMHAELKKDQD
ncbi:MAG: M48 family metalloprotease [Proteobacteria bacterium]|nr:M48 family metalloprotease [Pseudomonadota bacterium]